MARAIAGIEKQLTKIVDNSESNSAVNKAARGIIKIAAV